MKTTITLLIASIVINCNSTIAQPGSLDSSFGTNGIVLKPSGGAFYFDHSIAIQPDKKIVVVGTNMEKITLVRYKTNGALDKKFGIKGIVSTDSGSGVNGNAVALQTDGKIVIAGTVNNHMILERFKANGNIDSSFGIKGKVRNDLFDNGNTILIQPDGKIVVAGDANISVGNKSGFVSIARYNTDGSADSSFGKTGTVSTDITDAPEYLGSGYATSLALQADKKILLAGYNYDEYPQGGFVVVRYRPNGKLDNSFGTNGQMHKYNYPGDDRCYSIAVLPNKKILLAGYSSGPLTMNGGFDFVLIKLTADGNFDNNFGTNGVVLTDFGNTMDYAHKVLVQPDGKIVVSGIADASIVTNFALARYKPNGKPDKAFGNKGKIIHYLNRPAQSFSSALQPDGKIVLAGEAAGGVFALARYNGDSISVMQDLNNTPVRSSIKISPDPVQTFLKIEFAENNSLKKTIVIYDRNGQLKISKLVTGNARIDVQQLISGVYFIKIVDERGRLLYNGSFVK